MLVLISCSRDERLEGFDIECIGSGSGARRSGKYATVCNCPNMKYSSQRHRRLSCASGLREPMRSSSIDS